MGLSRADVVGANMLARREALAKIAADKVAAVHSMPRCEHIELPGDVADHSAWSHGCVVCDQERLRRINAVQDAAEWTEAQAMIDRLVERNKTSLDAEAMRVIEDIRRQPIKELVRAELLRRLRGRISYWDFPRIESLVKE